MMNEDYTFIAKNISSCINELQLAGCYKMIESFKGKYDTVLSEWLEAQYINKQDELNKIPALEVLPV